MPPLLAESEGYIRQLGPHVAARTPDLREDMQGAASVMLRQVNEVLDANAPRADQAARMHDLGVAVRALVPLPELSPDPGPEPAPDPGGWLLIVPPQ